MTKEQLRQHDAELTLKVTTIRFRFANGSIRFWNHKHFSDQWEECMVGTFESLFHETRKLGYTFIGLDISDNEVECRTWKDCLTVK